MASRSICIRARNGTSASPRARGQGSRPAGPWRQALVASPKGSRVEPAVIGPGSWCAKGAPGQRCQPDRARTLAVGKARYGIMLREDEDVSALAQEALQADGVKVLTGHKALRCELRDGVKFIIVFLNKTKFKQKK